MPLSARPEMASGREKYGGRRKWSEVEDNLLRDIWTKREDGTKKSEDGSIENDKIEG